MYYLNLTLNMDNTLKADALIWVKTHLIPNVKERFGFSAARLIWVKTDHLAQGITYAIQFETDTYTTIEHYHKKADLINQWIRQKYSDKILPFATELHVIEHY